MRRTFDILVAVSVLMAVTPLIVLGIVGIFVSSPGPVFFFADRVGRGGAVFKMYKLRSMRVRTEVGSLITSPSDARVFPFGKFIRKTKIDELPQFINVLKGDMSIVGPRPEDPKIVSDHYTSWMKETLNINPGITSPGTIFAYTEGDKLLDNEDPEKSYVDFLLEKKLKIDFDYFKSNNIIKDIYLIIITILSIIIILGKKFNR